MAAARPGPADARVPCPLCGGLIHPIAGRCKHCKGDLSALRSTRPAAAASLPALLGSAPAPARVNGHHGHAPATNGHAAAVNGHGAPPPIHAAPPAQPQQLYQPPLYQPPPPAGAPPAMGVAQAVAAISPAPLAYNPGARDDGSQILPPRPTGRFPAAAPRASWKSWPVVVIILAVIAIVTAVVLMIWPPANTPPDASRSFDREPAPDRMNVNPTPSTPRQAPSTDPDPWSSPRGGAPSGRAPSAQAPAPAPDDVDIDDPDLDPPNPRDPFSRRGRGGLGSLGGGTLGGSSGLGGVGDPLLYAIFMHGCGRVAACGTPSAPMKHLCDQFSTPVNPPACAAAAQCLQRIDDLSCDTPLEDPMALLQLESRFPECRAARNC